MSQKLLKGGASILPNLCKYLKFYIFYESLHDATFIETSTNLDWFLPELGGKNCPNLQNRVKIRTKIVCKLQFGGVRQL